MHTGEGKDGEILHSKVRLATVYTFKELGLNFTVYIASKNNSVLLVGFMLAG